ncbi:Heavy metal transport/detoxification protein [Alkaliphilus metalliredigens QYMF]|uniref:Heavy metal transport/detoxification protein n=1 Tax=Alkaliphilus metalliredigens (strain QYMF) TaxID=293826 RepID=A6TT90_ALKMQ|nr:heavy metal-associated domain-containing protein [Alkaliphilus metalliredigens]ABR49408.1 Heavy metal transport/detoxification protein [Alkaliphilus metalliredigens QYMF]
MKKKITIEGMSCGHCVGHVNEALKEISGVNSVEVNLTEKHAVVDLAHEVGNDKLKAAVDGAGYQAIEVVEI